MPKYGFVWGGPSGGGDRTRTDDPLLAKQVLSQLSYTPGYGINRAQAPNLVGLGRFELPTSRLSGVRSNRLSYRPGVTRSGFGRHNNNNEDDNIMPSDPGGYGKRCEGGANKTPGSFVR